MTDLAGLVERLEKATGPDRELDDLIMSVDHFREDRFIGCYDENDKRVTTSVWVHHHTNEWVGTASSLFTSSIDAAMTLVPEGFAVSVEWSPRYPGSAWLYPPNNFNDISFEAEAASPALALCAAALKARSPQP